MGYEVGDTPPPYENKQGKPDNKKGGVIAYLKVGLVEAVEKIAVFPKRGTGGVCPVNCEY